MQFLFLSLFFDFLIFSQKFRVIIIIFILIIIIIGSDSFLFFLFLLVILDKIFRIFIFRERIDFSLLLFFFLSWPWNSFLCSRLNWRNPVYIFFPWPFGEINVFLDLNATLFLNGFKNSLFLIPSFSFPPEELCFEILFLELVNRSLSPLPFLELEIAGEIPGGVGPGGNVALNHTVTEPVGCLPCGPVSGCHVKLL